MKTILMAAAALALAVVTGTAHAASAEDIRTVAALDTAYQAAVDRNDADAMAAILHEDFILMLGDGHVYTRDDLLNWARTRLIEYEVQDEEPGSQTVRLYGPDTAIVTALLGARGVRANGTRVDVRLWFSDTYVRTPQGWRYVFGQASTALPDEPS
jgi:ketosteroid isomerase-like protein